MQHSGSRERMNDTRLIMNKLRKSVLNGAVIHFVDCFPGNCNPSSQHIWQLSMNFGAVCVRAFSEKVTHVVVGTMSYKNPRTMVILQKYKEKGLQVVTENFIYDAAVHFRKPDEWDHAIDSENRSEYYEPFSSNPAHYSDILGKFIRLNK